MHMGLALDFGAHMYSIHFLKILYHYTCITCAHQWEKRLGATHRGQFYRWRAFINPCFVFAINCRSCWGSKHPLNSCTLCNSCKARKSSNPVVPSVQPPLSSTFIACYLLVIIHCKYDIVFVQFLLCFLYVFFIIKHVVEI
jgi:hypothetical protein